MTWTALQGLEVVSFLLLAGCAHLALRRSRRSLIAGLREIAGDLVRDLARVSDVVASLIYVAFAFTSVPMGYFQPTGEEIEAVLDTIGRFALVVAAVEVIGLLLLNRVAHHLDPWPPDSLERVAV